MIRTGSITIDRRRMVIISAATGVNCHFAGRYVFELACALILAGPKTAHELCEIVYRGTPDGGPLTWDRVISMMHRLRYREFRALGLSIQSCGTPRRYWAAPATAIAADVAAA